MCVLYLEKISKELPQKWMQKRKCEPYSRTTVLWRFISAMKMFKRMQESIFFRRSQQHWELLDIIIFFCCCFLHRTIVTNVSEGRKEETMMMMEKKLWHGSVIHGVHVCVVQTYMHTRTSIKNESKINLVNHSFHIYSLQCYMSAFSTLLANEKKMYERSE